LSLFFVGYPLYFTLWKFVINNIYLTNLYQKIGYCPAWCCRLFVCWSDSTN